MVYTTYVSNRKTIPLFKMNAADPNHLKSCGTRLIAFLQAVSVTVTSVVDN